MSKKILTKEDILHLAKLSRLELTEEEIQKYWSQLEETVEFVKNMDELDTKDVRPTNSVVDLKNVTYEDGAENKKELTNDEALSNAKNKKDGYFIVKRIM
ncbi:MAG: Asp-tRNA(Asn)/Glu-tRNA(Gln) amidotransferase subunit GatC [bacterium]|nr:Asp-tRNA(Asn)/Glu-tRNA(Gln) amidotransferase subunit GatC [bacterium]